MKYSDSEADRLGISMPGLSAFFYKKPDNEWPMDKFTCPESQILNEQTRMSRKAIAGLGTRVKIAGVRKHRVICVYSKGVSVPA